MTLFYNKGKIKNIYYFFMPVEHYNLQLLFEFEKDYLFFDNQSFFEISKENFNLKDKWVPLRYDLTEGIFIKEIKEDEFVSYFILFSNEDILYVYQLFDGTTWNQQFCIIDKTSNRYDEINKYMNENFVDQIKINRL